MKSLWERGAAVGAVWRGPWVAHGSAEPLGAALQAGTRQRRAPFHAGRSRRHAARRRCPLLALRTGRRHGRQGAPLAPRSSRPQGGAAADGAPQGPLLPPPPRRTRLSRRRGGYKGAGAARRPFSARWAAVREWGREEEEEAGGRAAAARCDPGRRVGLRPSGALGWVGAGRGAPFAAFWLWSHPLAAPPLTRVSPRRRPERAQPSGR